MEFDYYNLYAAYSNLELLKIVRQPQHYQEAAVAAAAQLLQERGITEEDQQQVDEYFQSAQLKKEQKTAKVQAYKGQVADFLEPVLQPQAEINPQKWVNIFLVVLAIQYLWTFFSNARNLVSYFDFDEYGSVALIWIISILYIPVIFYLVYKKKRWGWILLFADRLLSFIVVLNELPWLFDKRIAYRIDSSYLLGKLLVSGAFVFFLWKPVIANYFGATRITKRDTLIITLGLALLFIVIVRFT
jgi:uncharacterized protein YqgQ